MGKHNGNSIVLPDIGRVYYSLMQRKGEPFYFVRFKEPGGRRLEKSTKSGNEKRADELAIEIIKEAYTVKVLTDPLTWDKAIERLKSAAQADNIRSLTLKNYLQQLASLRKVFPGTIGPADITPNLAQQYKENRAQSCNPLTLKQQLNALSIVWHKWFIKTCGLLALNPWEDIPRPKVDKRPKRIITPEENRAFLDWLAARFPGWRTPVLWFEVCAVVGQRIRSLCSARTTGLQTCEQGSMLVLEDMVKTRDFVYCPLPARLFQELKALAGPTYVWERFGEQLREFHESKNRGFAHRCKDFSPDRMVEWLELQLKMYNDQFKDTPGYRKFTPHTFKHTKVTAAHRSGFTLDRLGEAIGTNPDTLRSSYMAEDRKSAAWELYNHQYREPEPPAPEPTPEPPALKLAVPDSQAG